MASKARSVASSNSPRLRARSSASAGLRQTIRRSRVIGAGDLDQIALVEQRELQRAVILGEHLDVRGAQSGDPVEPGRLQFLGDARLGDHSAITDQHHAAQAEALPQLVDLDLERARIGGIAPGLRRGRLEHLDRDRTALFSAQDAEDDLQFMGFAVAAVAKLRQRAAAPFQIGRGHVVEHQGALTQVAPRQLGLDLDCCANSQSSAA